MFRPQSVSWILTDWVAGKHVYLHAPLLEAGGHPFSSKSCASNLVDLALTFRCAQSPPPTSPSRTSTRIRSLEPAYSHSLFASTAV